MIITTASGSRYEFNEDFTQHRRVPDLETELGGELRQDGEWLGVVAILNPPIEVGKPVAMVLDALQPFSFDSPGVTLRNTTPVVSIDDEG